MGFLTGTQLVMGGAETHSGLCTWSGQNPKARGPSPFLPGSLPRGHTYSCVPRALGPLPWLFLQFSFLLIDTELTYNITLISGIQQHSDSAFMYITKCSPWYV